VSVSLTRVAGRRIATFDIGIGAVERKDDGEGEVPITSVDSGKRCVGHE